MVLNWTIEVISTFLAAIIIFFTSILTFRSKEISKIRSVMYLRVTWNLTVLFYISEGLSYLYLDFTLNRICALLLFFTILFFILSINYITKESIFSKSLILFGVVSGLYVYLLFQPESLIISYTNGFYTIKWGNFFGFFAILIQFFMFVYAFLWGYLTWKNAPFLIKREAFIFFLGMLLASVGGNLFYLLHLWLYYLIAVTNLSFSIGVLIISIVIIKQSKLLYILPFELCRISVKDQEGNPLFDHDWSESKVNELVFTGFINAIQVMSQELIKMGGLLDIHLQEGVVILHESERVCVGIVSSKSSKALRESLVHFTKDFEELFQKLLKEKNHNMKDYELAYTLIEKHFANFPSRLIRSDKQPLILTPKYLEIPQLLDNKLKTIFSNKEEYERIKAELIRAPLFTSEDFLDLYYELKDEIEKLENQE